MGLPRGKVCTDHVNLELFLISNGGFSWLINKVSSDYDLALHKNDNGEKMMKTDTLISVPIKRVTGDEQVGVQVLSWDSRSWSIQTACWKLILKRALTTHNSQRAFKAGWLTLGHRWPTWEVLPLIRWQLFPPFSPPLTSSTTSKTMGVETKLYMLR